MCDPEFRAALAAHGFTLDEDGEVRELAPYVGAFSARAAQIGRNIDRYEAEWRADHPGEEPGPRLRRSWDRRAWAEARPDKVVPTDGAELVAAVDRGAARPRVHARRRPRVAVTGVRRRSGALDRDAVVDTGAVAARCAAVGVERRRHPRRGRAADRPAGVVADARARIELAEDLTARAVAVQAAARPRRRTRARPVAHLAEVLAVEADIITRLASTCRSARLAAVPCRCGGRPAAARRMHSERSPPPRRHAGTCW